MKKYLILIITLVFGTLTFSCRDFEEINQDPNRPADVATTTLVNGAEKKMLDYVYDNWFSGRQSLVYAQYWAQRNYTEEDRYQIRESVNNNYFNQLYTVAGNLHKIEELNTDPETKVKYSVYGKNENQIAAAKILKVWLFQLMADTWGSIPYSEAFKLSEGINYPKYDDLNTLYNTLLDELDAAIAMIDEDEVVFTEGDQIYGGDPTLWKQFGNSLKCRLAIRLSKVDSNWKNYIQEAVTSGVFNSNDDQAVYQYLNEAPNECYFYRGFYVDRRNDFSMAKPMMDLLKGQQDTLNNKEHPWNGVTDPRLSIFTTPRSGQYIGIPYGLPSNEMTKAIQNAAPTWYSYPPVTLNKDFTVSLMTYAELCFILSEYNGFDKTWYEKGIRSSMEWWSELNGSPLSTADINAYIAKVNGRVDAETVATQKYIHLYMNGTEAWAEYRRTGYPLTLLKPGEITYVKSGVSLKFEPLSDTKGDLPARIKYPTNESSLNPDGFNAAVAKLQDGTNNYYSKMFWDVRTTANPHPANK